MRRALDPSDRWVRITGLILAALVLIGGVLQVRSQREARRDAEVSHARYAFQQELTLAYDAMAEPARDASVALSELREILQQHLALTGRTGDEIAADRDTRVDALLTATDRLAAAADAPPPVVPVALQPSAPVALTEQLAGLRSEAATLAEDLPELITRVDAWTAALARLRQDALAFVEVAESHAATTDPAQLAAQWRLERDALGPYRASAEAAASDPGLAPVAATHLAYIDANLAWIDEATALLDAGDLDRYNVRLQEVLGGDDPFAFRANLQAAIEQAFDLGVLAELATGRDRATVLLDRIAEARRLMPILLRPSDADAEPSDPSPTPTSPTG